VFQCQCLYFVSVVRSAKREDRYKDMSLSILRTPRFFIPPKMLTSLTESILPGRLKFPVAARMINSTVSATNVSKARKPAFETFVALTVLLIIRAATGNLSRPGRMDSVKLVNIFGGMKNLGVLSIERDIVFISVFPFSTSHYADEI